MLKKALVTGSAVGIGKAIAIDLASKGFDVAFHYNRSEQAAKQASQEAATHGVKGIALQADITKPDQAKSLVENAAAQLGGLSVVVNNVGNYLSKPTSQISVEEWHSVIDSNLNTTFYVTGAAIPYLKSAGWGRIVNIGAASAHNVTARGTNTAYMIAKTGIIIYTKSLAKELITDKITANVVSPGIAENSFEYDDDWQDAMPKLPAKRPATLSEIAHAAWFFISPEADYITGQVVEVSGGWSL
ncbi:MULTISPECIES: bifunctional dihydropteridine reductase/dihydrofolate reductase TmpR [Moorena]|uniref:Dihydropteridine reductase n=1 Tax=Moorena producens 3L TaxID=489825 RepID=F4XS11_9CYAN|nr:MULTISPECIES: bifunctional dihydropteridine reductase/dihydrofolate reductase TmpR [Moorena]NEQ16084.1 bifunctional dihydropteridine reductase/dihydrofolate reductase TmpR [Moorena sp. SIO3E2]EGJ32603.1 dihydropteridine reductase [Moorena producens 3L]NEP30388.1 bifunctional dihydropteridine reductase/dihydrofolate reductase TmpR [Moorena sp. SIO3B2]NEP66402.1 bifunctional dihydropteridine reductase/dihydrofolate reductase TmpR [Moorena sp. SIO3A5]NEQ08050.1 bifunctional dihydropteridine re